LGIIRVLILFTFYIFCSLQLYGEKKNLPFDPKDGLYLLVDSNQNIEQVRDKLFERSENIPHLLDRMPDKAIWIKKEINVDTKSELVFDFVRKDFVDLYIFIDDTLHSTLHTGFLVPSQSKKMGRWNAIDFIFEPHKNYTIFLKIVNTVNEPDLQIIVNERTSWREYLLIDLIKNIAFLSIISILSIYSLLIFFQNRIRPYLYFSMYLLTIFIFYLYILDILRDFFIRSNPHLTLYVIIIAILVPCFYFGFLQDFFDLKSKLPKWYKIYNKLIKGNVVAFILLLGYYSITKDYFTLTDSIRILLFFNVIAALLLMYQVWKMKNPSSNYFLIGSLLMLSCVITDLIIWYRTENIGSFSQIGFILEIGFFSMGMGKRNQISEFERKQAHESYVEQLKINSKLVEDQRNKLEKKVFDRTIALLQAKEEAERNAKAKEEFLSIMSHEIRTPMNAIVGLTHMLPTNDQDAEFIENLTTLRYSVDNLMLLINNVLDYNKISAGKVQLEEVDFNLKMIVNSVCHLFKAKADSKGLEFKIEIDNKLPNAINGDPFRLSQILNNFLSNAIKFTEKGTIGMTVFLLGEDEKSASISFSISDTGIGIPASKQSAIFESFTQVNPDTARKFGGTGLGLAISKDLIKLMGGEIQISSKEGSGSIFKFETVFKKSLDSPEENFSSRNYSKYKNAELEDLSVLIVDDNHLNRMVLKKFMDKWKVASDYAENGLIGLKKLKGAKFDLVLLDLQMPEMDGYEMAQEMTKDNNLNSIPVIAISADTISNVYDKVIASGMDDFITKPFNPDELKSKIYMHTSKIK